MARNVIHPLAFALALLAAGCREAKPSAVVVATQPAQAAGEAVAASDAEKVRAADFSILFVGNSHTGSHELPALVCSMIEFLRPKKTTYWGKVSVSFLEDVARDLTCRGEVETRPWKYVVLQGQKISMSGKYDYSRAEALELAKLARGRGMAVLFYPEWGRKGVPGDGARQEKVYREMAGEARVGVAPVARAWDLALAARPELDLYAADGNHQSALGAFLTACVLAGRLTGASPAPLARYDYVPADEKDREFLAGVAAKATAEKGGD